MNPVQASAPRSVLVTGGTGYLGRVLLRALASRGHRVRALVRSGSEQKVPPGVEVDIGDALSAGDVSVAVAGCDTLVHLVGVSHPSPAKARQFREIDLASVHASVEAARKAQPPPHLVYLSVAQPAPFMRAYVAVRAEGERLIREAGLSATCLRPWYVLGPGHRWPTVLIPFYALLRMIPATRPGAERLGFVTLPQMVASLVSAVENPSAKVRVVEVPAIASGS